MNVCVREQPLRSEREEEESHRFWSGGRRAQTHSAGQLLDFDMNPELPAKSPRHWKQTHSRTPLPGRRTESDSPPLQGQRDGVSVRIQVCHFC